MSHTEDDDLSDPDIPCGSYSIQGSMGGVGLTPTDSQVRLNNAYGSPESSLRQKRQNISRKPLMHPSMYTKSINVEVVDPDSDEKCDHCGNIRQQSGKCHSEVIVHSGAFFRQKYYNRLVDPGDNRMRIPDHVLPSSMFYVISTKSEVTQNSIVTIFAIWNTMMGTSLLSMPWGINQSGFILGIMIIIFTGLLAFYTAYRVVKSRDYIDSPVFEFSDVARHYFGPVGEWMALLFGLMAFVGGMMVYWVLMTNFLYTTGIFIHSKVNHDNATNATEVLCANAPPITNGSEVHFPGLYDTAPSNSTGDVFEKFWNVTKTTPFYLIVIIFPLMNFRSATFFTKFNCLGTASVVYLWVLIIVKAAKWGVHMNPVEVGSIEYHITFPALTGMLSLAFFLHNAVITILRNNRNQENNIRDLSIGYLLVMVTYLFVGTLFFATFPLPKHCISSNFLNNLSSDDALAVGARAFLLFQMITVFPLLAYIFRIQILHATFGNIWPGLPHVMILNVLLVAACILISVFYPHIGDIIRYSGSLCGLVYVFFLPAAVHMIAMYRRNALTPVSFAAHSTIILLGLANFIAQFLITPSK